MANKRLKKPVALGDKGKYIEGKLKTAFSALAKRNPLFKYRFPDTRTAGTYINSPADFHLVADGTPFLLEAKESEVYETFEDCYRSFLRSPQGKKEVAQMRLYLRARGKGLYVFYSHVTDTVEFWEADRVHRALLDDEREGLREEGLLHSVKLTDENLISALKLLVF